MSVLQYGQPVWSPVVPFIYQLPGELPDHGMFLLEAWAPVESQRFAINVQTGGNVNPRDDVALHLGFSFSSYTCSVTANTIEHNTWGSAMDFPNCPIRKMEPFQILILVQRRSFMVAVNNQHFREFPHRMDPTRIRFITADGQVTVTKLQLEFPGGLGGPVSTPAQHPAPSPAYVDPSQPSGWPAPPSNLYGNPQAHQAPAQPSHYQNPSAPSSSAPSSTPQKSSSGLMGMLPTGAAAVGALGTLATLAAPLLYPGKKNKMYKKGNKQRGLLGGFGLPGMGGAMGGGHCGQPQYGHGGSKPGGGLLGPGLAGGLGAAALGMGLSRMMGGMGGGRHHHGGYGGHGGGGWSRRSSSSSSSSSD